MSDEQAIYETEQPSLVDRERREQPRMSDIERSVDKAVDSYKDLRSLGSGTTEYITTYSPDLLETFPNPQLKDPYTISIVAPEWTALCPKTGQPDFATIEIEYSPHLLCVESKSLKLYFVSYRNVGVFHEAATNRIARDLFKLLEPHWIQVTGKFAPRGGISFHPKVRLESEAYKRTKNQYK